MDNLTHTLAGIVLARAGFNRAVPRAAWLLAAASNAPDLDVVTGLGGGLAYLHHHRGWTHAIAFSPVVALAALPLWWWLTRKEKPGPKQWTTAWLVAVAGVIAHHLMDWLNVYGIRLLLPFKPDWLRLDLVFIVDAWIWMILLMAIAVPALSRLVYSEIGAKAGTGRGSAWFALVLLACYLGLRVETHGRAAGQLNSRLYGGLAPLKTAAIPGPINPFRWTGLVETSGAWHMVDVDLLRPFDPEAGEVFHRPGNTEAVAAARNTRTARIFLEFSQWPLYRVVPSPGNEGAVDVFIHDARFGLPDEMRFTVKITVEPGGRVTHEEFLFGTAGVSRK